MFLPIFAFVLFCVCFYKARMVWYRDKWPAKLMSFFWGFIAVAVIVLVLYAEIKH